ncbi:MAG: FG-GAP-like repeat-containing protein, partial [Gammaproteobacteria bacterium]
LSLSGGANYSVSGTSITPAQDYNGPLEVPVVVNDSQANSPSFTLDVTVRPRNDAPYVIAPISDQTISEGELFQLLLADHFGDIDTGDTLRFAASGLPPSGSLTVNPVSGMLSGTPQLADAIDLPYQVVVSAQDPSGASALIAFSLTIAASRSDISVDVKVEPSVVTFRDSPEWEIEVRNLGPSTLTEGQLKADWFSTDSPLSLSSAQNCEITGNATTQPVVECALTNLPANEATTITVQSTHSAPGDSNILAVVTADDPIAENNAAGLSLNLAASFSDGPSQFFAATAADIAAGDLNNDGHIDLVVASDTTVLYLNGGNRELLVPGIDLGPGSGGGSLTILDWNLDGAIDIAIAGGDDTIDRLYLNDGLGAFPNMIELPTSATVALTAADLDLDGIDELIGTGAYGTGILRNNGLGEAEFSLIHPSIGRAVVAGELNGDGAIDIVVTDGDTRMVYVLFNTGNGTGFSESTFELGSVASVALGDVDMDGVLDLMAAVDGADLSIPQNRILRNSLNGDFSDWALVGAAPTDTLQLGDLNRDSIPDLVAVNGTGVHQIFFGDGLGNFVLADEHILSLGTHRGQLIDINGDTSLDLILAGLGSNRVDIHANDGLGKLGPGDRTPPVLSLLGATPMTIDAGGEYVEPGGTASDDIDGDLTAAIEVSGIVDTTLVGSYTVSYTVTDQSGNITQVNRIVSVAPAITGGGGGGSFGWALLMLLGSAAFARARTTKA